ncbi:CLUMA_CG011561, isoform A [Clunio marinus]|uniref:Deoxyhypusine hydroxylase n=1 Tax=Clunio marinus TaxID=568069 RepID=A0A1J1IGM7_9DIPT|nr:CLUMA_CG011561, isoform A [Clunio marinus]
MPSTIENRIANVGKILNDNKRPMKERFRALFTLKNIKGELALKYIEEAFSDDSDLLKHELAYCLGQMQDRAAIPILIKILEDVEQVPMVRHEAGEALGAIGHPEVIDILEKYSSDPVIEVAETCQIALDRVKWLQKQEALNDNNPYASVDPSPPLGIQKSVEDLRNILMNEEENLFDRYRAMFSLRNMRTKESILAVSKGLKGKSALFRHEIAFVLGQLQSEHSIPYLVENLRDPLENEMVRHECAEALGSIGTDECVKILNEYLSDEKRVKEKNKVKMVLTSHIRNAVKRIPMIKFRSGGKNQSTEAAPATTVPSAAVTSAKHATSGPAIEDWQLPNRYRRRPIDEQEIDAINSGGAY